MNDNKEMALKLLKFCRMPTSFSLAASVIYSGCAELIPVYDTETRRGFEEKSAFFEELACDILEKVSESDPVSVYS